MGAPIHPDEYESEHLNTDEKLEEAGWAAGLDVWGQVDKAYGNYLGDGTLSNAQLWSLRRAIRREFLAELLDDPDLGPALRNLGLDVSRA